MHIPFGTKFQSVICLFVLGLICMVQRLLKHNFDLMSSKLITGLALYDNINSYMKSKRGLSYRFFAPHIRYIGI